MDTEQIEQQMKITRAAIDAKLDQLASATATVRRRTIPAVLGAIVMIAAVVVWARRRRTVRRGRSAVDDRHLRKVG